MATSSTHPSGYKSQIDEVETLTTISEIIFSAETIRTAFVFFGGIIATLIGVYFKVYLDQFRWKINNIYQPLYAGIGRVKHRDIEFEGDGLKSVWSEFDEADKVRMDSTIIQMMNEYHRHIESLNEILRNVEDHIAEDVLAGSEILPEEITNPDSNRTRSTVNIIYARSPNGSSRAQSTVNNFTQNYGVDLIYSEDPEDLRSRFLDTDSHVTRGYFQEWPMEAFEGLYQIVENASEEWAQNQNSQDRIQVIEELDALTEDLESQLRRRMSLWRAFLPF